MFLWHGPRGSALQNAINALLLTWTCQFDGWVYFLRPGCLFGKEKPTGVYFDKETPMGVYFEKERPWLYFLNKETPVGVYL